MDGQEHSGTLPKASSLVISSHFSTQKAFQVVFRLRVNAKATSVRNYMLRNESIKVFGCCTEARVRARGRARARASARASAGARARARAGAGACEGHLCRHDDNRAPLSGSFLPERLHVWIASSLIGQIILRHVGCAVQQMCTKGNQCKDRYP
jgi:hypothetical protein